MARKNRGPEENARRKKIRELLQIANIGSMDDIQNLFKEDIAEFMANGLEAELDEELGYSKASTTIRIKPPTIAATAIAAKPCEPALGMRWYLFPGIGRVSLNHRS